MAVMDVLFDAGGTAGTAAAGAGLFDRLPRHGLAPLPDEVPRIFDDRLYRALIGSAPFRRLGRVSFLGAIDYVCHPAGRFHGFTRHDHSLGVARLALRYCRHQGLDKPSERLVVSAALLHDIGHGPLSHTLEPEFAAAFDIDHHRLTRDIILGRPPAGGQIPALLQRHGIAPDAVAELVAGRSGSPHAALFAGPLNIDTLDGILRTAAYVSPRRLAAAEGVLDSILALGRNAPGADGRLARLDEFWRLKQAVYRHLIQGPVGRRADALCRAYMRETLAAFRREDFLLTEPGLRRRHRGLFLQLRTFRRALSQHCAFVNGRDDDMFRERCFVILDHVAVARPGDLARRYVQHRQWASRRMVYVMAVPPALPAQQPQLL